VALASKSRVIGCGATVVVAGLMAATALAVTPPPSSSFAGSTAQTKLKHHGVQITTDANGHVSAMKIAWQAKCKHKGKFWTEPETDINGGTAGFPQNGDVFHSAGSYTAGGGGITGLITVAASGAFTDNDHAHGLWSAKVTVKRKGKTIDKCKVSKLKWKVARTA
jgi:hypothetical protein